MIVAAGITPIVSRLSSVSWREMTHESLIEILWADAKIPSLSVINSAGYIVDDSNSVASGTLSLPLPPLQAPLLQKQRNIITVIAPSRISAPTTYAHLPAKHPGGACKGGYGIMVLLLRPEMFLPS